MRKSSRVKINAASSETSLIVAIAAGTPALTIDAATLVRTALLEAVPVSQPLRIAIPSERSRRNVARSSAYMESIVSSPSFWKMSRPLFVVGSNWPCPMKWKTWGLNLRSAVEAVGAGLFAHELL